MLIFNPKPAPEEQDDKPRPPSQNEKGAAALAHLAGVFWLPILPMAVLALMIPVLVLQFARVHSDYVEQHAISACNFQVLMGCFYALAMLAGFVLHSALPLWWVAIGSAIFALWEGAKAINGWPSKYPVSLKLFK
ncbi:DUF4870 domain-containing protein [Janthinobacterium sp. B9-8]|uniref:DUF4870 domain-containing protein n=1 Tax=Janthinobacterium sp. B9-8 TaxID=1236179 RepID=UPI00061D28D8|nr:DUF4870 domain-containing protein [Janthinobacterium sp. B9-8]AMC36420.1 hypothetical protein VN23_18425 [Janthinobacterium sp. B9-8]